jgi:hypothetical protein
MSVVMPLDVDAGPQVDVRITLNGRASTPLPFTVSPWLATLTPVRTALDPARGDADLKLVLQGDGLTAPQAVRFDGPGGTATVAAFDAGGTDSRATVAIPPALANGLYSVRIMLADTAGSTSNSRTLEVIPRLDSVVATVFVTSPVTSRSVHQLSLVGARLNGRDVRIVLDGVVYQVGANANAGQLVHRLGRRLAAGTHRVSVNVDGQASRAVDLQV